jgi:hypothetical protein
MDELQMYLADPSQVAKFTAGKLSVVLSAFDLVQRNVIRHKLNLKGKKLFFPQIGNVGKEEKGIHTMGLLRQ